MLKNYALLLVAILCSLLFAPLHAADAPAAAAEKETLTKGISDRAPVEWTIAFDVSDKREHKHSIYSKPEWWKGYDVVVHDECFGFVDDDAFIEAIVKAHKDNRVPVVAIHCAVHSYRKAKTRAW